jgi:FkbM family methyltransferase
MGFGRRLGRLKPRKVRRAIRRRVFERRVRRGAKIDDDAPLVRLGTDYGGWAVPAGLISGSWICYCVGAGLDVSFELSLIASFGCRVWSFDPAEDSRRYVERLAATNPRLQFRQTALWRADARVRMYRAADPTHCSLSAANLQETNRWVEAPGRSLESLMAELGHDRVDLLKVDLEGSEYEVLEPEAVAAAGVRVLCVELHAVTPPRAALAFLESFRVAGFRPVHRELERFTLVRADERGPSPYVSRTRSVLAP